MAHPSPRSVDELEQSLAVLLRLLRSPRLSEQVRTRADVAVDRVGYAVLLRVAELAPARLSEVAHLLAVDISTASRQVARLEARGLVARSPDPDDRRAIHLTLTPHGRRELERTRAAWQDTVALLVGAWPEADVTTLASLLARFADELRPTIEGDATA